jgi:hypothetical protein
MRAASLVAGKQPNNGNTVGQALPDTRSPIVPLHSRGNPPFETYEAKTMERQLRLTQASPAYQTANEASVKDAPLPARPAHLKSSMP